MKREIGDKVKIREDLIEDKMYGMTRFTASMIIYLGSELKIKSIDEDGDYGVKENPYWWSEEMFENKDGKFDIESRLEQGEDIISIGEEFYEMLMKFHDITDEESKELQRLISEDSRFKDLNKRMGILGKKLGM